MSRALVALIPLTLFACGSPHATNTDQDAGPADSGPACAAQTVSCVDESISQLDLFPNVAPGEINEEGTTAGEFTTHIDATAGTPPGGTSPTKAFVYAKFTDSGLAKVSIDDESAFSSQDWDVAFRRYVIRVNSGVSGPSCVQVARTGPGTTFDGLSSVPTNVTYRTEEYFTETCDYVSDASGIGGPGTALSSYWTYDGCLKMTDNVYVVALANGRHVKLQVLRYYDSATVQQECATSGSVPSPSGGANLHIRWAFLP